MDDTPHPLRAMARARAEADAEDALRDAIDALEHAAFTARVARSPDTLTLAVMEGTCRQILGGLQ